MTGDVLSNDQVAALVAAAQEGSLPERADAAPAPVSRRVRTVDFTRPTKFTKDQQRRLELAHDTFCQTASTRLSAEMRVPMKLEVIDIAQLTWTNALAEVPDPSVSAIVELEPHRTRMLMTIELSLVLVARRARARRPGRPARRRPQALGHRPRARRPHLRAAARPALGHLERPRGDDAEARRPRDAARDRAARAALRARPSACRWRRAWIATRRR